MAARLLFVGDIHLGRSPTRLPADIEAAGGPRPAELTPAAAWRRTVEHALASRMDAVVLAGDVVDDVQDRFEAASRLQHGVERLVDAGIRVLAVVGNHDVEALPRVAARLPGLELIGAGGVWQRVRLASASGTPVDLVGWSFPEAHVRTSPLHDYALSRDRDVATLGVLHCDLDQATSRYAPVSTASLRATELDAWLLGHVHGPGALQDEAPIGYLGSLCGLDPGEPGPHGPWEVEVHGPGRVRASQVALAPLRWEPVEIELGDLEGHDARDLEDAVAHALEGALRRVHERLGEETQRAGPLAVGCRVHVSGRGRHRDAVHRRLAMRDDWPQLTGSDGVHYFVEKVVERAAPDLDLAALAAGADPPALLARRLQALAQGGAEAEALVGRVAARLERVRASHPLWQIDGEEEGLADEALRELIARVGSARLDALLEQRVAGRGRADDGAGAP